MSLCVGQLAKWQARLWWDIRMRWSDVWDALRVGGEMNAGSEETERVWRVRWDEAATDLQTLDVIHLERPTPRLKQARAGASTSLPSPTTTRIGAGSLETACSVPSGYAIGCRLCSLCTQEMRLRVECHSITAWTLSGHWYYVDAPESPPLRAMAQRSSVPMSLHQSSSS